MLNPSRKAGSSAGGEGAALLAQRFSRGPTEDHSTLGSRQLWEPEGGGPRIPRRDRKTSQGSSEEKREECVGGASDPTGKIESVCEAAVSGRGPPGSRRSQMQWRLGGD